MQAEWVWLANGGRQTLASYGESVESRARDSIPAAHLDFMRGLRLSWRAGGYFFVHAGVQPGVGLEAQDEQDLLWIRAPFLGSEADHGAVVVHGHTPRAEAEIRRNRINIDTGAVFGGPLTCLVLEGDRMGFLQA
jgi:serine/threonine protein phosphatase 1